MVANEQSHDSTAVHAQDRYKSPQGDFVNRRLAVTPVNTEEICRKYHPPTTRRMKQAIAKRATANDERVNSREGELSRGPVHW
jgi:hypothetical protein